MNTPRYRPTRVNHVIDGSEFGWRTGSVNSWIIAVIPLALWLTWVPVPPPAYAGYGAKFPQSIRMPFSSAIGPTESCTPCISLRKGRAIWAGWRNSVRLTLPLTDLVAEDGAMYIAVGGGKSNWTLSSHPRWRRINRPVKSVPGGEEARKRRQALEKFVQRGVKPASQNQLNKIWSALGAKDRGIRHAARVALENNRSRTGRKAIAGNEPSHRFRRLDRAGGRMERVLRMFSPKPCPSTTEPRRAGSNASTCPLHHFGSYPRRGTRKKKLIAWRWLSRHHPEENWRSFGDHAVPAGPIGSKKRNGALKEPPTGGTNRLCSTFAI